MAWEIRGNAGKPWLRCTEEVYHDHVRRVGQEHARALYAHLLTRGLFAGSGSWDAGRLAAAKWIEKRRCAFADEYGLVDPATGVLEFGNGHPERDEYYCELSEIEEAIRALPAPQFVAHTVPDEMTAVYMLGKIDGRRERHPLDEPAVPVESLGRDAEPAGGLDAAMRTNGLPAVSDALGYSRNFAAANPHLTQTTKDHITGLCDMLELASAHQTTPSTPPPASVPDGSAYSLAEIQHAWDAAVEQGDWEDFQANLYTPTNQEGAAP